MKKLYSLLVLMLLGMTAAWATDVTFTAGTDTGETSVTKDGVTVSCSTMSRTDNYRVYKNTALTISSTAGDITRVEITGVAGNPASNMTAPTAGSWSTSGNDGTWTGSASEFSLTASVAQARITKIVVTIGGGGASVATPVISGTTPFTDETEVTIACATQDDDLEIYYTLDGATPSTSSTLYQGAFTITESCTVKAVAFVGEVGSSVASKDFVKKEAAATLGSIEEFNALDPQGEPEVTFGIPVMAIHQKGTTLYVQDVNGNKGMLVYGNVGQTYELGNIIPSGFGGARTNYSGAPELKNPTGFLAATSSIEATPKEVSVADCTLDNFGLYVVMRSVEVSGGAVSGVATYTNTFGVPIPTENGTYDMYGVLGWHNAYQILPIKFVKVGDTPQPTLYTVHIDDGMVYGSVSANPMEAAAGATIELTVTPDSGYKLDVLEVKDATGAEIEFNVGPTENVYVFDMPEGDAYVSATFVEEEMPQPGEGSFVKVTSSNDLTSGTYLIVYEDGGLALDGGPTDNLDAVGNSIEVTIANGVIEGTSAAHAAAFTYDATAKTLKGAGGLYMGQTSDANGMKSSATETYENAISIDANGNADIVSGGAYLRYNSASNQTRFRYYKSSTYSAQQPVALYKLSGEVPPAPEYLAPTILINGEAPAASYKESELPLRLSIVSNNGVEEPMYQYALNTDITMAASYVSTGEVELNLLPEGSTATVRYVQLGDNTLQVWEYLGDEGDQAILSPIASAAFTIIPNPVVVNSIAEFAAQEDGKQFEFGTRVNVIAQTADKKYTYVQDENNGMILYNSKGIDQEYGMGNVIPAGFSGTKTVYRGQLEMQNPEGLEPATSTIELTPLEATLADVNAGNFGRYAVLRGVNINYENNTGYVVSGDASVALFDRFDVGLPEDLSPQFDVYGIISIFNDNLQFLPLVYETVEPEVPHAIILDVEGQGQILVGDGLTEALAGTDVSFRVIGDEGWRCDVIKDLHVTYLGVDDEPVEIGLSYWVSGDEDGYSFVMPDADVTISAVFEQYLYNIVKDVTVGGDVEVQETADAGALIFFTAVPAEHYELYQIVITYEDETGEPVNVDYQAEEDENTYSFFMPAADVNLLVEFAELPLYGITYNVENVTVEGPESAYADDEVVFTVTPDEGYILKSIDASYIPINGESNVPVAIQLEGPDSDGAYSFVMPAGRVAINIVAEEDLPHLTLAQVLTEGVAGQTYYIDNDVAIYTEGVTVQSVGSMYFITDNEGTYMPIGVPRPLINGWPKAGLAAGFKAMAYDLRGERILVFVDGQDIDMLYVVDQQAVDRVFEPINYKVYRLNGFVQEVDGELYLSEYSGLNGSIQASCHLVTENVTLDITDFEQGKRYEFIAVPAPKNVYNNHAPQRTQAELQKREFVVISSAVSVITGIENLNADDAVSVTYVNMQGAVSDRPFDGVNIVVTQHADGSVTTVKVLK